MTELPLEGGCLCGSVRCRIDAPPLWIGYRRCTTCRHSTGAPVTLFVGAAADTVKLAGGKRTAFASPPGVERGFCATCRTPLTYEAERCPDEIHFCISTFDDPQPLQPTFHVFHEDRLSWLEIADDLPRHAKSTATEC